MKVTAEIKTPNIIDFKDEKLIHKRLLLQFLEFQRNFSSVSQYQNLGA
jgi:hypothetical protein